MQPTEYSRSEKVYKKWAGEEWERGENEKEKGGEWMAEGWRGWRWEGDREREREERENCSGVRRKRGERRIRELRVSPTDERH